MRLIWHGHESPEIWAGGVAFGTKRRGDIMDASIVENLEISAGITDDNDLRKDTTECITIQRYRTK